ncbi:CLUMA_CG004455, isoform A [Clunio marinus]|uniref:CLUMA_CG004455, isoform A n=1 Tax=Clunio marinus TaxID=568069 RepID=A0A1J1HS07_9DIPT|nr:CLUMA_CG004455, isoform A [Clunio marinus]
MIVAECKLSFCVGLVCKERPFFPWDQKLLEGFQSKSIRNLLLIENQIEFCCFNLCSIKC